MKKLILHILLMMALSMLLVLAVSRLTLHIFAVHNIVDATLSYHITLLAGFLGLGVFALLLYFFVVRRLNKINQAVKSIAQGELGVQVKIKGNNEISQLADNFNAMSKALNANEYLNREFVRNVSHEFKTPVSIIKGYAELMEGDLTDNERQEYAQIICKQAQLLDGMTVKLLQISRLDSNMHIVKEQSFAVDEQIRSIILSMQKQWQAKELDFNIEMDSIEMCSDEQLCYYVWQNLISNAIKYSSQGSTVDVRLRGDGATVVFAITNSGLSLAGKEQIIFQPFYTEVYENESHGTSLGLPLVAKILNVLGGEITLTANNKNTFEVKLPLNFKKNASN